MTRSAIITIAVVAASLPPVAAAQVAVKLPPPVGSVRVIDDVRTSYRVRLGGLYVDPAVILKEMGTDSNVFNQEGDAKGDLTVTLTPAARLAMPFARRALVKATTAADLVYYARYDSERSIDPLAVVRAEAYLRRITLFGEEGYVNTRQVPNDDIDLRARHVENDLSGGAALDLSRWLSIEAALRHSRTRFDGDAFFFGQRLQDTLDSDTMVQSLTARYRHSSLTTLGLRFENQTDRFVWSPVRDTDSFRLMGGVEFRPRAIVNGTAWIGYRRFAPQAAVLPSHAGVVSQLALSYTLLGATTFGIRYDRDYQFAYEVLTPYFIQNNIDLHVRRALGGPFDVLATFGRHRYDYQAQLDQSPFPETPGHRVDTTDSVGLNVGYQIGRTRAGVGVSYATRDSTERRLRHYERLRAGVTMTRNF
jgi:hypothetical protein